MTEEDKRTRRFRSFVARPAPPAPAPAVAEAELPVLTEIVAPESLVAELVAIDPVALRATIDDSLKRWIDEALLPQLLEKLAHGTRQKL